MAKWFSNYYLVTSLTQEVSEYFLSQESHYLSRGHFILNQD